MKRFIEQQYVDSFRRDEVKMLHEYLRKHQSVALIGMKRVGVSNFLRFFLSHAKIENSVFVQVDLNDLIERNLSAFWTLLLTRVVDAVQRSPIDEEAKKQCRKLFVQSIQLKDHFFTLEAVRTCLSHLTESGLAPTLFLIRFDRIADAVTPEFFSNLVGLRDAVKGKMSYVITSFRPLGDLAPQVFTKSLMSTFATDMYLPPASARDMESILATLESEYHIALTDSVRQHLITLSGGYVQYLQLMILRLREEKIIPENEKDLIQLFTQDEQINLQSEELFESLTDAERKSLTEQLDAPYLTNTGMVKGRHVFSPLFSSFIASAAKPSNGHTEFTKKEHTLMSYLEQHIGQLCERDAIIAAVWPEQAEAGVSDWAIDRLVARLRVKLKQQHSPYSILTVVTRGYKLMK